MAKKKKTTKKVAAKKPKEELKYFGRPGEYRDEFCQQLEDHMAQGFSFESFAGLIGVHRGTLYRWAKENPGFNDAKKHGTEKSRLFWEDLGVRGSSGKAPGWNPTGWIYNVKNRFPKEWNDRREADKAPVQVHSIQIELPDKNAKQVISMEPERIEGSEDE